jgi:hypothetical protein
MNEHSSPNPPTGSSDTPSGLHAALPRLTLRHSGFFYWGLLPVIIVVWAWADSMTNRTSWHQNRNGGGSLSLIIENAAFRIEDSTPLPDHEADATVPASPPYAGIYRFDAIGNDRTGKFVSLFPELSRRDPLAAYRPYGCHHSILAIPFWLILACYIPLWMAISYWHVHGKKMKLRPAIPSGES